MRSTIAKALDLILLIPTLLALPLLWALARLRVMGRASRALTDAVGIAVIRKHYYEPVIFPGDLKIDPSAERNLTGLDLNLTGQLTFLNSFNFSPELAFLPLEPTVSEEGKRRFYFHNGVFESGDAEIYYSVVRFLKPARIIEIGSGYSTLIAQLAISKNRAEDASYDCHHTCVEPYENEWLEKSGAEIERKLVEDCDLSLFQQLHAGDILFIDSTHMIRPQGDVLFECLTLLGSLAPGVIVHIHDIFTPRNYPKSWLLDDRRLWNEQYLLEAFLSFNDSFEVLAALNWLKHNHFDILALRCPILAMEPKREPGSFWFKKTR